MGRLTSLYEIERPRYSVESMVATPCGAAGNDAANAWADREARIASLPDENFMVAVNGRE